MLIWFNSLFTFQGGTMKFSHASLIALSGLIWLAIGAYLMPLGLNFLIQAAALPSHAPLMKAILPVVETYDKASLLLVAAALFIGYFKGRVVLGKSVRRSTSRILALPNPAPLSQVYDWKYYLLIGLMVLIGLAFKFAPLDIRGFVDVTIGSALINGAMLYFRAALEVRQQSV